MHGFGVFRWKNGARYEGDWREGYACGIGKYYYPDGCVHEGMFIHDEANGYGKYTYKNGNIYSGDWKEGKKEGRGKLTYIDG